MPIPSPRRSRDRSIRCQGCGTLTVKEEYFRNEVRAAEADPSLVDDRQGPFEYKAFRLENRAGLPGVTPTNAGLLVYPQRPRHERA